MEKETFELLIGRDTKIICRKPTQIETYIHSVMNLLNDGPSKFFVKRSQISNNFYFRRNGFNNDV